MANLKNTTINAGLVLPSGGSANRPNNAPDGSMRFNQDLNIVEVFDENASAWFSANDIGLDGSGGLVVDTIIFGKEYRIHYFLDVGTFNFTVNRGGEVDYLIVAGGGQGGFGYYGGGGGAGGLVTGKIQLDVGTYTITVGKGGSSNSTETSKGESGADSSAFGFTAIGGGGGGSRNNSNISEVNKGSDGGSGGGSSFGSYSGGSGIIGQGNSGGSANDRGGGGGGFATAGTSGENYYHGGPGGAGGNFLITGTMEFFAAGGGGGGSQQAGPGGYVGGGEGGNRINKLPTAGRKNTGSGGGGGGGESNEAGERGADGIIIIKYVKSKNISMSSDRNRISPLPQNFQNVLDGMCLHFDASHPVCYPGTGNLCYDLSGNGNTGILENGVSFLDSNGGVFDFDGIDDVITVGNVKGNFTEFTVSIWFYPFIVEDYENIIDCTWDTYSATGNVGPRFELQSDGDLNLVCSGNTGDNNAADSNSLSNNLQPRQWYMATFTRFRNTLAGFLNGETIFEKEANTNGFTGIFPDVRIGRGFHRDSVSTRSMRGYINDIQLYSRGLSPREVKQIFESTRWKYGE